MSLFLIAREKGNKEAIMTILVDWKVVFVT